MKKTRNSLIMVLLLSVLIFSLTACGKSEPEKKKVSIASDDGAMSGDMNFDYTKGKAISKLTGEWVEQDIANRRPICLMINNIDVAMPQTGLANADIMYECLVEGGITRLMGVFQDYTDLKKLGPVRSARHYYVDFANEYGAIYCHFGQTKYATAEIDSIGIDTISGLSAIGTTAYFRDEQRVAPHNAYTSGKTMKKAIKEMKYDNKMIVDNRFLFNEAVTAPANGTAANKVTLGFNSYSKPWFEYNAESHKYLRFQYGGKHIDDSTGDQLAYTNIIVQFVKEWNIDKKGYQTIDVVGSGDGYYISEGAYIPIKWSKSSVSDMTQYTTADGQPLSVNTGKTWISIFPNDITDKVVFE